MMCPSVSNSPLRSWLESDAACIASHPEYLKYASLLSPGWIPGRLVDNSDQQYASFRDNVPYLLIIAALHPLLRKLFNSLHRSYSESSLKDTLNGCDSPVGLGSGYTRADRRLNQRMVFDVGFSLLFLLALHGFSAFKILIILYINYGLATQLKKEYVPAATWIFNIGILFSNELSKGYPYKKIASAIRPWSAATGALVEHTPEENWGSLLDRYGGLNPRWEILFNVTVLRLISFNFDYYWSLNRSNGGGLEVCDCALLHRDH